MSSKLRIKIGDVEIDYEGTEEFLKQELPQLLKTAMELHKSEGAPHAASAGDQKKHVTSKVASLATGSYSFEDRSQVWRRFTLGRSCAPCTREEDGQVQPKGIVG